MKDEEIAYRKDMKQKLSTKMIGETLELHCESEFNRLRATGFQTAYLKRIMTQKQEVKAIMCIEKLMKMETNLYLLCLK